MTNLGKSICIFSLIASSAVWAKPVASWKFESDSDGITIYSREHSDGLVEIRARMFAPTSYGAFLLLLEDTANVPNWIDNVSLSRVIKQISSNENIVYTQFAAPWPAKDRDMVTYSKYSVDEIGFTLNIKDAPPASLPEQEDYIRITSVKATWTLQKLTNGSALIEYVAFADPGGALPDWLANKLAKESARNTFMGLREQLPNYQGSAHPNIKE
ncbi:START domain-containing protein [Vibrio tubiashii]|uniref:START domain-containing protein n=1 Tax=Vibrio tubiashii ATCC 19109 TaxID=1051646 RepID=F9T360_9VIBR|nr:START domain-containing protein [Vibrio tubiashii]AIW16945.1 hypothetical protein IX91_22970 [Vibrio tubiashii ATCC 19109]EGU57283.1 hypothetical protein VITU9109_06155 [Vibrio tubiashii ATCC 19109]EIF04690.1 hypothetical protein VT1337_07511 [Vibrio tubiashii NCIMB 1337 = ATCC 19106]